MKNLQTLELGEALNLPQSRGLEELKKAFQDFDECKANTQVVDIEDQSKRRNTAFVEKTFQCPPVREVKGRSRPTQRYVFQDPIDRELIWAEGGNELTAALILTYLKSQGLVRRFKLQPFRLAEIDETLNGVPDILVELNDFSIYVVEVKAHKFITVEVNEKLQRIKEGLNAQGINYLLWTDTDNFGKTNKLNRTISENVKTYHRGLAIEIADEVLDSIRKMVHAAPSTLKELHAKYGWDTSIAAWSRGAFDLDIKKQIDENAVLQTTVNRKICDYFFETNEVVGTWWSALENLKPSTQPLPSAQWRAL